MMNAYRLAGDAFHLLSFVLLMYKLRSSRRADGISRNTQDLYSIVFLLRYVDIFWNLASLYNVVMKVLFIACSVRISVTLRMAPLSASYDEDNERVPRLWILGPSLVGAALAFYAWTAPVAQTPFEFSWITSLVVESFAIVPQLAMLQANGVVENLTSHYVASLGIYRFLYICNWIYRWRTEMRAIEPIIWITGIVQTLLYMDFFWYYFRSKRNGLQDDVVLPTCNV